MWKIKEHEETVQPWYTTDRCLRKSRETGIKNKEICKKRKKILPNKTCFSRLKEWGKYALLYNMVNFLNCKYEEIL